MAITFGSVGDIIAVCLLAKDVVDALNDSRGSAADYRDIVQELAGLEKCLLHVDLLCRTQQRHDSEVMAICDNARATVQDCRITLQQLSSRLRKYDKHMAANGGLCTFISDTAMKVRFRISEKEWIEKSRATISSHRESLGMLLATANVKLQQLQGNKMDEMRAAASSSHQTIAGILQTVNQHLGSHTSVLSDQRIAMENVAERISWISQTCADTQAVLGTLLSLSSQISAAVMTLQTGLPSSLERSLADEPFILEDALGRKAPVHLQFIDSWDALHAVLEIRFQNLQGAEKVAGKEYVLQDHRTGRDILPSRPWVGTFLPGQRVEMSMIFKDIKGQPPPSTLPENRCPTCPRCQLRSVDSSTSVDVNWYVRRSSNRSTTYPFEM